MKKLALLLVAIVFLATTGIALAIDTSEALYSGLIRITNNGTAATNVSVNFTANTAVYIDGGYMNQSANNTGVSSSSGADIIYMPGFNGTNPWIVQVPSIGQNNIQNDTLFMGGATDMEGLIRYFPGTGGMAITDNETLEPGDNFSISVSAFINTDNGTDKNLFSKGNFRLFISPTVSGNITGQLNDFGTSEDLLSYTEDDVNAKLTVTTTNATAVNVDTDEDVLLYDDKGVGALDGLNITFGLNISSASLINSFGGMAIANSVNDATGNAATDINVNGVRTGGGAFQIQLFRGFVTAQDVFVAASDTDYFLTLSRPAGGDTVTVEVFTDSARSVSAANLSVSGFGATTYRYFYAFQNQNSAVAGRDFDGAFSDFSLGGGQVSATGVNSGEHIVILSANTTDLVLTIDGLTASNITIQTGVPNTTANWTFVENESVLYMVTANVSVNGTLAGRWSWENAATFADNSTNSNTATPTFRTTSSDVNVSAVLVDFLPITEAKAPSFTVNITTAGWITGNISQTGNFTTTINATYPGSDVIVAVTDAGNIPIQLLELIMAGVIVLSLSLFISWVMRTNREGSLLFKIAVIVSGLGVMIAVGIVDEWILYLFTMISVAIAMAASQRNFTGTGNSGNNMIGFLAMSFFGMTMINRILEGRLIQSSDVDLLRNTLAFQPFEVFGLFTIPVPNTDFLLNGIPALMRWDYSYFGGNAQIFQYMLYSVTTVVSFMLFVLVFGAIYQMFSRGR